MGKKGAFLDIVAKCEISRVLLLMLLEVKKNDVFIKAIILLFTLFMQRHTSNGVLIRGVKLINMNCDLNFTKKKPLHHYTDKIK